VSAGTRAAASAQARRGLARTVLADMRGADLTPEQRREVLQDLRAGQAETARWRLDTYLSGIEVTCLHVVYPADRINPVEYCGGPVAPGQDRCDLHQEDR